MTPLLDAYAEVLTRWLESEDEDALEESRALGRVALAEGQGLLSVFALHHQIADQRAGDGRECLTAFLAAMEMGSLGYRDSVRALRRVNEDLEARVQQRTEALSAAERRAWALIEQLPATPFVLDGTRSGTPLYVSPQVEELLGITAAEWMGNAGLLFSRVEADDRAVLAERIAAWDPAAGPLRATYRVRDGQDTLRWLEEESVQIEEPLTGAPQVLGLLRDVTVQHRLQSMVGHAQRMESIGQFAGGIAHDFNNLLGVILGFARIAQEEAEDPAAVRDSLAAVIEAAEAARGISGHLRTFSRQAPDPPQRVAIDEQIEGLLRLLRSAMGLAVRLRASLEAPESAVLMAPDRMVQILLNLCLNARDAMERGGVVTLRTSRVEVVNEAELLQDGLVRGSYVCVEVIDNGPGIPPGIRERIFEPFFTTKERGRGTGMGLATVHGIVVSSGGVLRLRTELGMGTTFEVWLPVVAADGDWEEETWASEKILLVDDDPISLRLLETQLRQLGYMVDAVGEPTEALARVETGQIPDILVTDTVMPGLSGTELALRVRAQLPGLPVLQVSGFAQALEALSEPTAVLRKPVGREELGRVIRRLLSQAALPPVKD